MPASLAEEPIIRVILDGTVVRVRLDRKATSIVLLVVLGVREDGQKVLLAVKKHGVARPARLGAPSSTTSSSAGCASPEFLIVGRRQRAGAGPGRALGRRADANAARSTSTATLLAHAPPAAA